MRQKRSFFLNGLLLSLLLVTHVQAQDMVYFASDGSAVSNTRITDIADDKLILTVGRDGLARQVSFSRPRIALAFTRMGQYLLPAELDSDPAQARRQLQAFLTAPARQATCDFLVKTTPLGVIAARVAYESDGVINYVNLDGNAASISTRELTAMLHRDGRHQLFLPAAEAAPLLVRIREQLTEPIRTVEKPAVPAPTAAASTAAPAPSTAAIPDPDSPADTAQATPTTEPNPLLSADERAVYRKRALSQIDTFASYVSLITDQHLGDEVRDKAIEAAAQLFLPESTVEVTSTQRPGSRRYSVRQYLTRLKVLPYQSTHIDWVQTQLLRDLTQNPDGSYSGTIAGQQLFAGYTANGKTAYTDLTPKNVHISLDHYQRNTDLPKTSEWRVLLGNIRVEVD